MSEVPDSAATPFRAHTRQPKNVVWRGGILGNCDGQDDFQSLRHHGRRLADGPEAPTLAPSIVRHSGIAAVGSTEKTYPSDPITTTIPGAGCTDTWPEIRVRIAGSLG